MPIRAGGVCRPLLFTTAELLAREAADLKKPLLGSSDWRTCAQILAEDYRNTRWLMFPIEGSERIFYTTTLDGKPWVLHLTLRSAATRQQDIHRPTFVRGRKVELLLRQSETALHEAKHLFYHGLEEKETVLAASIMPELANASLPPLPRDLTPLGALRDLREAISLFSGHGMPGFSDRALAYIVIQQADEVLAAAGPPPRQTTRDAVSASTSGR